jgi:hypothetical protein
VTRRCVRLHVDTFISFAFHQTLFFFFLWHCNPIQALAASMKPSVSLQLLDLGQSVGLLGRLIHSSQGLYLYTNTEKRTHNTNTKHPCPEWDSKPRSRCPHEQINENGFRMAYTILVGNSKVKRRLWNCIHKVDVNEKGYEAVEWIYVSGYDAVTGWYEHGTGPSNSIEFSLITTSQGDSTPWN